MNTINDKINKEIEKEKIIFNEFELLWDEYNLMIKLRNAALSQLKKEKLRLSLDILVTGQHSKIMTEPYELAKLIEEKIEIIKNEQELLDIIKRNIIRLQIYKITDFNNEIYNLINLIKYKNDYICTLVLDYVKLSLDILKGYNINENDIEKLNINDIDNQIKEYSLKLGLNYNE